jgi:hypothetical protein
MYIPTKYEYLKISTFLVAELLNYYWKFLDAIRKIYYAVAMLQII